MYLCVFVAMCDYIKCMHVERFQLGLDEQATDMQAVINKRQPSALCPFQHALHVG